MKKRYVPVMPGAVGRFSHIRIRDQPTDRGTLNNIGSKKNLFPKQVLWTFAFNSNCSKVHTNLKGVSVCVLPYCKKSISVWRILNVSAVKRF